MAEAARALGLISGIDLCKEVPAGFWQGIVTRIVADLDEEPGAERMMMRVRELLAQMWRELDDKPQMTEPGRSRHSGCIATPPGRMTTRGGGDA